MRKIRIGIDVGGTHTKAVAIDNATNEIVGKGSVMTTHHHEKGVAQGVVDAFEKCLAENNVKPEEVIFIAHSTTQATNALLEGDVAKVGVIGISGGGLEGFLAKKQTNPGNIDLGTGKEIEVISRHIKTKDVNEASISSIIDEFISERVEVIVGSKAFGVDNMDEELIVADEARKKGILTTSASDITKLYGLATRTKTAALNASILPKMLETANSTEASVRSIGITVPLMIMRGDGGVMEINEMKKRPILTMLSGPAASVIGALMYLRASNGIYFEVGGTSTNIGVIKNGRPTVDYSIIGKHRTYVNSLDVRVLGVAGGSMVRANRHGIIDVGPRSAHIANMGYACFTDPKLLEGAKLYYMQPRLNDPSDYVAIKLTNGENITITNTCAANALQMLEEGDFALGNYTSSYKAVELLAISMNKTVSEVATEILDKSIEKIIPVINELINKYQLEREQVVLVGAGGGAGTLLAHTAKRMGFKYQIPEHADVISSIGVALAMVREMVERTVPNPTVEDISKIKREAKDLAIMSGAVEDTIEVYIEIDDVSQKITAIAMGSTEVKTTDLSKNCTLDEAIEIVKETFGTQRVDTIDVLYENGSTFVLGREKQIRIVDNKGFVKVQRTEGSAVKTTVGGLSNAIQKQWDLQMNYSGEVRIHPDIYVVDNTKVIDYAGLATLAQVIGLVRNEFSDKDKDYEVCVVSARNAI